MSSQRATTGDGRRLRIAVIGCGHRGTFNARAVQPSASAVVRAVVDSDEALARRLGEELGVKWSGDYAAVLRDDAVDAVFVNTPHWLHAEQAAAALEAGKHVIVEKPLATTLENASGLFRLAKQKGLYLTGWLGRRYSWQVAHAKRVVSAGALGRLLGAHFTLQIERRLLYWLNPPMVSGTNWRASWDTSGGGVLLMNGIHFLDAFLYLAGLEVREVSARYATLHSPAEVEDSIAMWLAFENGAVATVNMCSVVLGSRGGRIELALWGTDGHLALSRPYRFFSSRLVDGRPPERWHTVEPPDGRPDSRELLAREFVDRFARAVIQGQPLDISARETLHLHAVIDAAYRSSREGKPIAVEHPPNIGSDDP